MSFLTQGKTNWKYILIVLILAIFVGGGILWWGKTQEIPLVELPEITKPEKPSQAETADWKTYRNEEYGFEVKYPLEFTLSLGGPNYAQQAIDRGEYISGTVQPSYDTIIFSDGFNELGRVEIFHKYEIDILEENYEDKYLYLFGPCDMRWAFEPEFFSLDSINNIKILTVKGKNQEDISQNCNYLKNPDGNLIVISNKEYKPEVFNQILSTFKFIEKDESAKCSPVDIPNYEVYAELKIDLNSDGKEELVRVYREYTTDIPMFPIVVKIFSGAEDCPKENFSYQGKGNEVWDAQAFSNFWGDGVNAVMVTDVSYAGGSGSSAVLRFFTYRNEYAMIKGPQFEGHNWQCCKFDDGNAPGKKIIGAESRWNEDYSDYCAGCPSRFQFFIYTWNGKEYIKTEAGTTKNKYSGNIDEILQKEPTVLEELE